MRLQQLQFVELVLHRRSGFGVEVNFEPLLKLLDFSNLPSFSSPEFFLDGFELLFEKTRAARSSPDLPVDLDVQSEISTSRFNNTRTCSIRTHIEGFKSPAVRRHRSRQVCYKIGQFSPDHQKWTG